MTRHLLQALIGVALAATLTTPALAELPYDTESEIEWLTYEADALVNEDGETVIEDDLIPSGQTVYAILDPAQSDQLPIKQLTNSKYFKIKASKGDDDKTIIKKVSLERKQIDGERQTVVAIELKEVKKDKEYEISPYVLLTTKKDCFINTAQTPHFVGWEYEPPDIEGYEEPGYTLEAGTILRIDIRAYVGNSLTDDTDIDLDAGTTGRALNPIKNTRNEIT